MSGPGNRRKRVLIAVVGVVVCVLLGVIGWRAYSRFLGLDAEPPGGATAGPCLVLTLRSTDVDAGVGMRGRLIRAGDLPAVDITKWAVATVGHDVELTTETGTPVVRQEFQALVDPDFSWLSQTRHVGRLGLAVRTSPGLTVVDLRVAQDAAGTPGEPVPDGAMLHYRIDTTRPCTSAAWEGEKEVRVLGEGTVRFRRR